MNSLKEKLMQHIDQDLLTEMTKELVRIPSYEGIKGQETKTAEHIKTLLEREGISAQIEEVADGRCNVYARNCRQAGVNTYIRLANYVGRDISYIIGP